MSSKTTLETDEGQDVMMNNDTEFSSHSVVDPCIFCPLKNLGNTCYFNAGVQLLVNCPSFVYSICNSPFRHTQLLHRALRLRRHCSTSSQNLFQAFAELVYQMEFTPLSRDESISPLRALESLAAVHSAFEGRQQQDCPEMVNVIIANVSEESRQEVDLDTLLNSFETDAVAVAASDEDLLEDYSVPSPTNELFLQYQYPGSWWYFNILRLMRMVNKENELLERKEKDRKKQPYENTFRPPKLFVNSAADCFTGYSLSEVQCHACGNTSRIVEEFSSLTIDIPSDAQRLRYARAHPEIKRVGPDGVSPQQKRASGNHWMNPLAWVGTLARWFFGIFTGFSSSVNYPVTLQECLDVHFEPVLLTGNNKYHCGSCNSTSEATKRETLLSLPDYLLVQMKRFEYGHCFNTKKIDPVIFPVSWNTGDAQSNEVLRLGDYLHESVATPKSTLPSSCRENAEPTMDAAEGLEAESEPEAAAAGVGGEGTVETAKVPVGTRMRGGRSHGCTDSDYASPSDRVNGLHMTPQFPIHTYSLEAVVNHHGSIRGGHYTAYAHKKTEQSDVWVYLNDDDITTASLSEVADSEEYLLLYKKQPLHQRSDLFYELRNCARLLLATPPQDVSDVTTDRIMFTSEKLNSKGDVQSEDEEIVFISRPWLERMAFMEEPGPILNRLCYCSEEQIRSEMELQRQKHEQEQREESSSFTGLPVHVHGPPVEWFFVPLQRKEYNAFYRVYGGNLAVTQKEYKRVQQAQHDVA
ncbi:ubiqitin hydrolase [Trypanosoma theileri]|uniref:Ubiqitin hydrolase n=1 Tax=Trypanosoma theileri TaxID=67003 RepID=A0A1X0NMU1_9TRYP|nr:ubiqitin hydrolase [Trypanosoma theileri]ORC86034.1 ubiqitin hydrolase [Trypanosoma theileri]